MKNISQRREMVSMVPIAMMQTILANEYDFYNFVLKRLDEQLRYIEWTEKNG